MKKMKLIQKKHSIFLCIVLCFTLLLNSFGQTPIVRATNNSQKIKLNITSITDSKVTLKWNKINMPNYRVYKYDSSKESYVCISTTSKTSITIKNLSNCCKYYFVVRGYKYNKKTKKSTWGKVSNKVCAVTLPKKVTNIKVIPSSNTSFELSWNKDKKTTGYEVYSYNTSTDDTNLLISTNKNEYKVTNATNSIYYYIVPFVTIDNKKYTNTRSTYICTSMYPSIVPNVKISSITTNSAVLSWNQTKKATSYNIYQYNQKTKKSPYVGQTSLRVIKLNSLKAYTSYHFKIRGINKYSEINYYGPVTNIKFTTTKKTVTPPSIATNDTSSKNEVSNNSSIATNNNDTNSANNATSNDSNSASSNSDDNSDTTNNVDSNVDTTNDSSTNSSSQDETNNDTAAIDDGTSKATLQDYAPTKTDSSLATPTISITRTGIKKVHLSWNKISNIDGYYLYKYDQNTKTYKQQKKLSSNSFDDANIKNYETLKYKIKTYKNSGDHIALSNFSSETKLFTGSFGIDISKWQGNINWKKVADAGVEFAIIATTKRSSSNSSTPVHLVKDEYFEKNINGAIKNGIKIGVYSYSIADSVSEAKNEADLVLSIIKKYKKYITFPVSFDYEVQSSIKTRTQAQNASIVSAFCDKIQKAGFKPGLYSGAWIMSNKLAYNSIKKYNLWVANYLRDSNGEVNRYKFPSDITKMQKDTLKKCNSGNYTKIKDDDIIMWQFSERGSVSGISDNYVDFDFCYKQP